MTNVATFDAALQLLFALGGLLQVIAGFLIFLSSYLALFFVVLLCLASADLIYKAATWISARPAKALVLAKAAAIRFELKSKITHA